MTSEVNSETGWLLWSNFDAKFVVRSVTYVLTIWTGGRLQNILNFDLYKGDA
jgi:hypothetical protein